MSVCGTVVRQDTPNKVIALVYTKELDGEKIDRTEYQFDPSKGPYKAICAARFPILCRYQKTMSSVGFYVRFAIIAESLPFHFRFPSMKVKKTTLTLHFGNLSLVIQITVYRIR